MDEDQIDKFTSSALTIGLTGGIEKHREFFGRLSGYFGGEAGVRSNPYYTSGYYGKLSYKDGNNSDNDYQEVGGNTLSVFAGGLAGVEFYFAPRIALMGEFGYYLSYYTQMKRTYKPATGDEDIIDLAAEVLNLCPIPVAVCYCCSTSENKSGIPQRNASGFILLHGGGITFTNNIF